MTLDYKENFLFSNQCIINQVKAFNRKEKDRLFLKKNPASSLWELACKLEIAERYFIKNIENVDIWYRLKLGIKTGIDKGIKWKNEEKKIRMYYYTALSWLKHDFKQQITNISSYIRYKNLFSKVIENQILFILQKKQWIWSLKWFFIKKSTSCAFAIGLSIVKGIYDKAKKIKQSVANKTKRFLYNYVGRSVKTGFLSHLVRQTKFCEFTNKRQLIPK